MAADRVVTLYRRHDCGPCEVAFALLEAYAPQFRFRIDSIEIDGNPDLVARYGDRIPVAAVEGREIASAPFRRGSVEDALAAVFAR